MAKAKKIEDDIGKILEKANCRTIDSIAELEHSYSVSTGIFNLDTILTKERGICSGIMELYGKPGTGKTSLSLSLMQQWIKNKNLGEIFYFNVERRLYKSLIDVFPPLSPITKDNPNGNFHIINPQNTESCLSGMEAILRQKQKSLIVLDSLASCLSESEYELDYDKKDYARLPAMLARFFPKSRDFIYKNKCFVLILNQTRDNISRYAHAKTTKEPGGNAIKFFADWRVELKVIERIKNNDQVIAQKLKAETTKNAFMQPYCTCEFHLFYGRGYDQAFDLANSAILCGLIEKSGSWFNLPNGKSIQGVISVADYLRDNEEVMQEIKKKYIELVS